MTTSSTGPRVGYSYIAWVQQAQSERKSATDVYKELGIPLRSQRDMLKKNLYTDCRSGRTNCGRPPKIDLDMVHKMEKHIQGRYQKRTLDWEGLGIETGVEADAHTIKRRMNALGYRKCRACQKKWLSAQNIKKSWTVCEEWRYLPN